MDAGKKSDATWSGAGINEIDGLILIARRGKIRAAFIAEPLNLRHQRNGAEGIIIEFQGPRLEHKKWDSRTKIATILTFLKASAAKHTRLSQEFQSPVDGFGSFDQPAQNDCETFQTCALGATVDDIEGLIFLATRKKRRVAYVADLGARRASIEYGLFSGVRVTVETGNCGLKLKEWDGSLKATTLPDLPEPLHISPRTRASHGTSPMGYVPVGIGLNRCIFELYEFPLMHQDKPHKSQVAKLVARAWPSLIERVDRIETWAGHVLRKLNLPDRQGTVIVQPDGGWT